MATTTNYGWTTPDNTDLVKDGALAIRTLGSAIDTSMNTALGTKKAGMVLLNTTSFSGVTSVSLPANTFTSTYQHYFIQGIFYLDSDLSIRLRAAGTDNSTASSYQRESQIADGNTTSALYSADNIGFIGASRSGGKVPVEMFVYEPALAVQTHITSKTLRIPTNMQVYNSGIIHNQSVAYDSMTFIASSGNFATGSKVSVYGMNQ